MNLGEIELDEQKVRDVAMEAAFQVAKREVEDIFQRHWHRESPHYDRIRKCVAEVADNLLASPEFKARVVAACEEKFIALAEEKIANAVARTSVSKLKGEA